VKKLVVVGDIKIGEGNPLVLIAGPCVIESKRQCMEIAKRLAEFASTESIPLIFKASYDKANRSSHESFRGPGLERGLAILAEVRERVKLPVLTDVHCVREVEPAGKVVDVLQIPAFLCRQTDLVMEVARTGKPVNVKKGQFMAPWDMKNVIEKIESQNNYNILITERGTCFGYNNLVADMRSLMLMKEFGYPVVFDATHSVQRPGAEGKQSGGDRQWVSGLARAAVATGCNAIYLETHIDPSLAKSDASTQIPLSELCSLWRTLKKIYEIVSM
jgi:2-dehydro-3-deoxyphosphooctonate aldolase (KDO 8-P synthase)